MDTSFVPSLQHLTCSRLIVSIFNHLEVHKNFRKEDFESIKRKINEAIPRLTPCARLQEKLEVFVDPLLREIEDCLDFFGEIEYCYEPVSCAVRENIPQCWLSDGTIDREKLARFVVTKKDLHSVNRFIYACTFCFFNDALDLWNVLSKIEKIYLRRQGSATMKLWIQWLESSSEKVWESFLEWSLGTPLWQSNVYILKRVLQTLSTKERSRYLLDALIEKEVDDDVMRFCMSVMTKYEQDQIFRNSTVQVLRCMLSWPLRPIIHDVLDNLWPYFTKESFCNALHMFLRMIKTVKREDFELLIILKNFWAKSPEHLQNAAKYDPVLSELVQNIQNIDVSRCFLNRESPQKVWRSFLTKLETPVRFPSHQWEAERLLSNIREMDDVYMSDNFTHDFYDILDI